MNDDAEENIEVELRSQIESQREALEEIEAALEEEPSEELREVGTRGCHA